MIELGYAKAKSKATNQWVEGYFFKYEKFSGKENEYILFKTGENKPGEAFMENPVSSTIIWKETLSFFSGFENKDGQKLYRGDILRHILDEEELFFLVDFSEESKRFIIVPYDKTKNKIAEDNFYEYDLFTIDFDELKIIENINDDFNLSKKEIKEKRRKKNLLPLQ